MKYIYSILLMMSFLVGCNKSDFLTEEYGEANKDIIDQKLSEPLNEETIREKIKNVSLDLTKGVAHGEDSSVYINLKGIFIDTLTNKYFSYIIPTGLSDNYKILFEFHENGSLNSNYLELEPVYKDNTFWASKNTIIINPIGSISNNKVGWSIDNKDLYYVDILIGLFKKEIKDKLGLSMDEDNMFVTGQSSGAIFSWGLAYYRNNYVSVAVPRFGSYAINATDMIKNKPTYKVPVRIFTGKNDATLNTTTALHNTRRWSELILNYKLTYTGTVVINYPTGTKDSDVKNWTEDNRIGKIEWYNITGQGQGFSSTELQYIYNDYIWKFMEDNLRM